MKTSLIISTYNRPDALRLCLLSAISQTRLPDEIIVGDDGSRPDTREAIDAVRALTNVPIIHVWHPDEGFRLAMMRNKAVAASSGEYIIETDGDVILHPAFVADHVAFARRGHYCKGGRCNLGRALTEQLCAAGELRPIRPWTRGIESKPENAIHCTPLARWLAPRYRRHRETALGCNMSFFRDDFYAINGYDEFFVGWGGEDGDFGRRLNMLGLTKRHLKFAGLAFHLWHEDKFMHNKERNFMHAARPDSTLRVPDERGAAKYLREC